MRSRLLHIGHHLCHWQKNWLTERGEDDQREKGRHKSTSGPLSEVLTERGGYEKRRRKKIWDKTKEMRRDSNRVNSRHQTAALQRSAWPYGWSCQDCSEFSHCLLSLPETQSDCFSTVSMCFAVCLSITQFLYYFTSSVVHPLCHCIRFEN